MSKVLYVDKTFVYIDDNGIFLEVKLADLNFSPSAGDNLIIKRNDKEQIISIELVEETKGAKKRKPPVVKPVEKVVEEPKIKKEVVQEPAVEPAVVKEVVEEKVPQEEIISEPLPQEPIKQEVAVDEEPKETVVLPEHPVAKKKGHFNRVIEVIIAILSFAVLGGFVYLLVESINNINDELVKLGIFGGLIAFGILWVIFALFLPKRGRIFFNTILIIVYFIVMGFGIYFLLDKNGLDTIINLVPQLTPIKSFFNSYNIEHPMYSYYIMGGAGLPTLLGILYFIRNSSYKKR